MDLSGYFEPVDAVMAEYRREAEARGRRASSVAMLGDALQVYTSDNGFPNLDGVQLVLLGVKDGRASIDNPGCGEAPDAVRKYLYRLARPYEPLSVADLGNIAAGATVEDTHFAVIEALHPLLDRGITVVLLGGGDDLLFPVYKAYEILGRVINICSVDSQFNLDGGDSVNSSNYLQHIILQQPNYLFDYVSLGYQSYLVGPEMVHLMDELKFTTYRVGELQPDMDRAEPPVRYCDVVALDVAAVRQSDAPAQGNPSPHGFYGEEVCRIARFAGMSDKTSCFALTEMSPALDNHGQTAHMLAHALWFFIEGFKYRLGDHPSRDKQQYKRFTAMMSDSGMEIVFYKSLKSDRWWMEVPCSDDERRRRYQRHTLVPCSYSDYQCAMENEIPDLWWHYYNRMNG